MARSSLIGSSKFCSGSPEMNSVGKQLSMNQRMINLFTSVTQFTMLSITWLAIQLTLKINGQPGLPFPDPK